ncbi:hypothetical protein QC764_402219 [Podospora pseudoanserina]|uniref:Spherulin-4 n=1 Tax=Podospora pseudoanserina TaxID=2609844 RepID=A0ABR0I9T6_9PEZI|nr:hypothetical protein QC764_402219 [Podospora pseudoanserina]
MGTKMTKLSSPSQNNNKALILLPLYIYPSPDAWTPLLLAANRHPTLQFLVVVNPSNGPGEGDRPDENYVRVLQQLRDVENVKLVGYVYCSYGKREQGEMRRDVERYKVWGCEKRGCGVDIKGIFFDEAPADGGHVGYMAEAAGEVRSALGEEAVVVYNPGVFPDQGYWEKGDYVVVFENVAREWWGGYVRENVKKLPKELRERSVVIAHSCQGDEKERILADVRRERWGAHFLTEEGGYESWDGGWGGYVGEADEEWDGEEEGGCC